MNFGARIREARRARGWSKLRLAVAAGINKSTVQSAEEGRETLTEGSLARIFEALETPACAFFGPPCDVLVLHRRAIELQARSGELAHQADTLRDDVERLAARRRSRRRGGRGSMEVA